MIEQLEEEKDRAIDYLKTLEQLSIASIHDLHEILKHQRHTRNHTCQNYNDQWKGNQISINPYSVDPSSTEYNEITKIAEEHDLKIMPYDID
ncbi:unnamed protein product [Prunus brigantina]